MVNGEEQVNLLRLSRAKLQELLKEISARQGEASTEAQRIRDAIEVAKQRERTRLPQRRFGFPVRRVQQAQQETLRQRREATEFIGEGTAAIQKLNKAKAELEKEKTVVRNVLKARQVFTSKESAAIFTLENKQQREFFRAIKARSDFLVRRAEILRLQSFGIIEPKGKDFEFTQSGLEKIQAGEVDFTRFRFIKPPTIVQVQTVEAERFGVTVRDEQPKKSFIVKGFERFRKFEEGFATRTTRKIIPADFGEKTAKFISRQGGFFISVPTTGIRGKAVDTPIQRFAGGVFKGGIEEVRERPVTLVALAGAGKITALGLRGVGAVSLRAGAAIGGTRGATVARRFTTFFGLTVAAGATGLIGVAVVKDLSGATTSQAKGEVIGKTSVELAAFGVGARVGSRVGDIIIGRVRTRGLTDVTKTSKLFDPAERAGRVTFPELAPKETPTQLRARFFEPKLPSELTRAPRAFTATDIAARDLIKIAPIGAPRGGTIKSEFAGQFGADVISPNFLRVGGSSSAVRTPKFKKLLQSFDIAPAEPTVIRSELVDIVIPKSVGRTAGRSPALQKELTSLLGGVRGQSINQIKATPPTLARGKAVLPFIKSEREIIIVKGTQFNVKPKQFFAKVEGVRIPIIERVAIPASARAGTTPLSQRIKSIPVSISESSAGRTTARRSIPLRSVSVSSPKISRRAAISRVVSPAGSSVSRATSKGLSGVRSLPTSSISVSPSTRRPPVSGSIRAPPLSSPRVSPARRSVSLPTISSVRLPPIKSTQITRRIIPPRVRLRGTTQQRRRRPRFTDDLTIVPDISARVAGITVTIPKAQLKGVAAKGVSPLSLRGIPVIK